jgi:nucleoid DNA-binding protein
MDDKKPLCGHIAQAAGISEDCAGRAIDATLSGFRCLLHREEITVPGGPTPQIAVPGGPTPQIAVPGGPTPQIAVPGGPTPQVAAAGGPAPQKTSMPGGSDPHYRRHCRPAHRSELVEHIAHEAGISKEAAGLALAAILAQVNSIGADAGVRAVLEYRP